MAGKKLDEAAKQRKHEKKMQKEQHDHEMALAIVNAMASDPELKFFIGAASGSAVGALGAILKILDKDSKKKDEKAAVPTPTLAASPFGWLGAQIAELGGVPTTSSSDTGMFGFIPNLLTMAGTGFAGFCAAVLLLKAIFGDEDVSSLATGIGTLVDASVPLT